VWFISKTFAMSEWRLGGRSKSNHGRDPSESLSSNLKTQPGLIWLLTGASPSKCRSLAALGMTAEKLIVRSSTVYRKGNPNAAPQRHFESPDHRLRAHRDRPVGGV